MKLCDKCGGDMPYPLAAMKYGNIMPKDDFFCAHGAKMDGGNEE